MEGVLLQSRGGGAVLPAQRSLRRQHNRLCARASARGVRQLAVSLDKLRLTRDAIVEGADDDGHVVNGRAAAAVEVEKLRAVAEAAADRAEMHDIIGRQRDGWNHLLVHSTNSLALAASVMAALAPGAEPTTLLALKASAGALLATTAVTMAATSKVQPSQLAEEQRNATRLWRQLERDVRAALQQSATDADVVHHAMDRVLALDAAYPLPLLPQMLDKFPKAVEPTRWWPRRQPRKKPAQSRTAVNGAARRATVHAGNGWTPELEDEMRGIARAIKAKDEAEYVSNAKLALALNRGLAVAGPALAGAATLCAAFIGSAGSWASGAAVVGGALAAAVNTVEHGGQVGMVFETFRNVAGTYRKIREDIEANLDEPDVELRESGEVFQTKVALLLGRSASDLELFREMASPSFKDEDIKDFAGKLL